MENQLVIFELSGEHYGVDIATVEGIIKMQPITAVPHAPDYVEGVTNLRGEVLPVIDLRSRFGFSQQEENKDIRIVVIELETGKVGVIVDAVSEVLRVSDKAVEPPSPIIADVGNVFLKGIAKVDDRLIILLDLVAVLSEEEQAIMGAMLDEA